MSAPAFLLVPLLLLSAVRTPPADAGVLRGHPLMQRYTAEDFPAVPSHQGLAVDARGVLHVGNAEGILRFAGGEWELTELPARSGGRSLTLARDGRLYLGAFDRFGILHTRPSGELHFEDLRDRFQPDAAASAVGDVWNVLGTPRGVFFHTTDHLYYLGFEGQTRQWPLAPQVRNFIAVGEALYARQEGIGVTRFEDGRLLPLAGAEIFAQRPLIHIAQHTDGVLLFSDDGVYLADAAGIRPLRSELDAAFARHRPYAAHTLADGSHVFGALDGTLLRASNDLRLLDRVPLGPYVIQAFTTDPQGGLWVASEAELIRLHLPSPWTAFSPAQGLPGTISDSAWYDETLWVATSTGLMRAEDDKDKRTVFRALPWTQWEAYDLQATPAGLLLAERHGVQVLDPDAPRPRSLAQVEAAYALHPALGRQDRIWVLGEHELLLLALRSRRWQLAARWTLDDASPTGMVETAPGELWLGSTRAAPTRWRIDVDRARREDPPEPPALPAAATRGADVLLLDGKLHLVTRAGVFRLSGDAFETIAAPPFSLLDRALDVAIRDTPLGTYAWTPRRMLRRAPGSEEWNPLPLGSSLAPGFVNAQVDADGLLRVITWNALLQFDPSVSEPAPPLLRTGLEYLQLHVRAGEPQRLPVDGTAPSLLPAGSGLFARFGLISMESGAEFRYRMSGITEDWTRWRRDREVFFRTLPHGVYRFEVEARSAGGRMATPFTYSFQVQRHWYQSPWLWLVAAIVSLFALAAAAQLVVQLRYRRYVAVNRRLERRISERTAELEIVNRKLSELATEDELTGVPNRRALEHALMREWQRCGELAQPLAVIMIDVDFFKQYNDRHGHLEGDRQLRHIAQTLAHEVHPVRELLARFGGEEFAAVLPGLHLDEAAARAEAMRRRFNRQGEPLTVSLGVAVQVPAPGSDPQQLLRRADTALYRAKRRGRNRIEVADE